MNPSDIINRSDALLKKWVRAGSVLQRPIKARFTNASYNSQRSACAVDVVTVGVGVVVGQCFSSSVSGQKAPWRGYFAF